VTANSTAIDTLATAIPHALPVHQATSNASAMAIITANATKVVAPWTCELW
jgi:hypothetical protein